MERYEAYPLKVYDSLKGEKRRFEPLHAGRVGLYVCGPTVYSPVHLGNTRTFIAFDLIYRYLKHLGYSVRYVRNITDVGHLEYDADTGEDKIAREARRQNREPMEVVQRYTSNFHQVLQAFNCLPPDIEPTATGHLIEQLDAIRALLEKKLAYQVNGSVYFDLEKYETTHRYGALSRRHSDELIAHSRALQGSAEKRNPQDFALWKKAPPSHIMRWTAPWGEGFPGWHLECTAMSTKYLGAQFDLHGGGMDLKFPHHECEIAQGQGLHGKTPARYWLHANMLTLNGEKMSKSTGHHVLPEELIQGTNPLFESGFHPTVIRFFMMQAHYRGVLDLSEEAIEAAGKGYRKLMKGFESLQELQWAQKSDFDVQAWVDRAYRAMSDDFNSPVLIALLFEALGWINRMKAGTASLDETDLKLLREKFRTFIFEVLGLQAIKAPAQQDKLSAVLALLIELRDEARSQKDWARADRIRDRLEAMGIQLKDGKCDTGFTIEN